VTHQFPANSRLSTFVTRSEEETELLGERLGSRLEPGSTLLLFGDLGAGKTTLVRGIAKGLGIEPEEVNSPTFVLINEYRGRLTMYHVDLYRIEGPAIDELGLEELSASGGVVVIEWADRLTRPPQDSIRITIADKGDTVREIMLRRGP
jgi:tRNA threonylcarbamoyladenosine biosynthesis protein TsaE